MADREDIVGDSTSVAESLRRTRGLTIFHSLLRVYDGCAGNVPASLTLHIVGADHRWVSVFWIDG